MKTFDRKLAAAEPLQDTNGNKVTYFKDTGLNIPFPIMVLFSGDTKFKHFSGEGIGDDGTELVLAAKKITAWVNVYRTDRKSFFIEGPFSKQNKAMEKIPEESKEGKGRGDRVEYLSTVKVYEETV